MPRNIEYESPGPASYFIPDTFGKRYADKKRAPCITYNFVSTTSERFNQTASKSKAINKNSLKGNMRNYDKPSYSDSSGSSSRSVNEQSDSKRRTPLGSFDLTTSLKRMNNPNKSLKYSSSRDLSPRTEPNVDVPGPGSYNVTSANLPKSPSFTMQRALRPSYHTCAPSPNTYNTSSQVAAPSIPSFTFGRKHSTKAYFYMQPGKRLPIKQS